MTDRRGPRPGRRKLDRHLPSWLPERFYRDVWLLIITIMLVLIANKALELSSSANANQRIDTAALCTLRGDLQTRVSSSERFLAHHPHGFAGISAATIQTSIANEQRTITALSSIRCPH